MIHELTGEDMAHLEEELDQLEVEDPRIKKLGEAITGSLNAMRDMFNSSPFFGLMSARTYRHFTAATYMNAGYSRRVAKRKASRVLRKMRVQANKEKGRAGRWGDGD